MALKISKSNIAIVIIFLIAGFVGYAFIWLPSEGRLAAVKRSFEQVKEHNELLAKANKAYGKVSKLEQGFGTERDETWLMSEVHSMVSDVGMRITSTNPQVSQKFGDYVRIAVRVEAESTYHDLGQFVCDIENSRDFLKIEELSISKETGGIFDDSQAQTAQGASKKPLRVSMSIVSYSKASADRGGVR